MQRSSRNGLLFFPVAAFIVAADVLTKAWATYVLSPAGVPHEVLGEYLRFTLVYNTGAAFGLRLGDQSRWIFMALTIAALVVLWRLYRATKDGHFLRVLAIAMVTGGAIGNLVDRIRSAVGVVDFIDVGLRDLRWPTFNIADMAVSTGAFLLAWVLWGDDVQESTSAAPVSGEAVES